MKDVAYCENSKWDFVYCCVEKWMKTIDRLAQERQRLSIERQSVADGLR